METVNLALSITLRSAILIFAMFGLLWGMLKLLLARQQKEQNIEQPSKTPQKDDPNLAIAAAAAVAVEFSKNYGYANTKTQNKPPVLVSAWQLGMRTRQMYQKSHQRIKK